VKHLLTFDIEDWFQSTWDFDRPISDRALVNTQECLDLLEEFPVKATFFVQGMVTEKYPELIRQIHSAGHELASHAYSHRPLFSLGRSAFREELKRSIQSLENISGAKVIGFRAPDFSIERNMDWFWEELSEQGILYDSSVFPKKMRRYGFDHAPREPFRLEKFPIVELPLSVIEWGQKRFPFGGGGYLRLLPYALTSLCMKRMSRENIPTMLYLHPYELAENDFKGEEIPWKIQLHQGLFRSRIKPRLRKLLKTFQFQTCGELIHERKIGRTAIL